MFIMYWVAIGVHGIVSPPIRATVGAAFDYLGIDQTTSSRPLASR
jgi:hypothetical protein